MWQPSGEPGCFLLPSLRREGSGHGAGHIDAMRRPIADLRPATSRRRLSLREAGLCLGPLACQFFGCTVESGSLDLMYPAAPTRDSVLQLCEMAAIAPLLVVLV